MPRQICPQFPSGAPQARLFRLMDTFTWWECAPDVEVAMIVSWKSISCTN